MMSNPATRELSLKLPSLRWLGVEGAARADQDRPKWGLSVQVSDLPRRAGAAHIYC